MGYLRICARELLIPAFVAAALGASMSAAAAGPVPENVGGGLRQLIEAQGNAAAALSAAPASATPAPRALRDTQGRVLVNVVLDGGRSLQSVHQSLVSLGAQVVAENPSLGKGVISAYLPVERARELALAAGVKSVLLESMPTARVGKVTTQGFATMHADKLNAIGITGKGITIGVLSDSYDHDPNTKIHAAQDIKSGDLPGKGNPFGHTQPVVVVDEDPVPATDEGRAMLQIIHDIAPDAKLCFATAATGVVQFAANIVKLADPKGKCKADVIVDDFGYSNEPFFSDGVVALAVDQVKADGVAYFSSAGNDNNGNYSATFNPISDAVARSKFAGNLGLGAVGPELTAGGFHNFGTAQNVAIALPIFAPANTNHFFSLQWDDAFFDNTPTASYNILVFDSQGVYHPDLSGIDNVYSTSQPVQGALLPGGATGANYFVVIALRPGGAAKHAVHLQLVDDDDGAQAQLLQFADRLAPAIFGHPAAAGAIAVAANFLGNPQNIEFYSSLGPVTIYLDHDNQPLAKPDVRQKPEIAAPDGVDTTFFGFHQIADDPNGQFFGTSAAAPHAAAVGALLIQAAGGPGQLSPDRLKQLLEDTTQQPHQLRAGAVSAIVGTGADTLSVNVQGYLADDPNQFRFNFKGAPGHSVAEIVLDATQQDIVFGDKADGFLIGPSNIAPGDIAYRNNNGLEPVAKLDFLNQSFTNGRAVQLGLGVDDALLGGFGRNSNLLFGAKVTATFRSGNTFTKASGLLSTPTGRGFSPADGFGLIDAFSAFQKLKGAH